MTAQQWFDFLSPFAYVVIGCLGLAWWAHHQATKGDQTMPDIKRHPAE